MNARFTSSHTASRARLDVVAAPKPPSIGERPNWAGSARRRLAVSGWSLCWTTPTRRRLRQSIDHPGNHTLGSWSGGDGLSSESKPDRRLLDGYLLYVGDPPLAGCGGGGIPA